MIVIESNNPCALGRIFHALEEVPKYIRLQQITNTKRKSSQKDKSLLPRESDKR